MLANSLFCIALHAHSHIDPGWLRTIDEYRPEVYLILNSVLQSLQKNSDRKFTWGETVYFKPWFETLSLDQQKLVRHLIKTGRLEMVNGGWVQTDEDTPSYTSIIDQMTNGLQYMQERFGVRPKIAWQIDPFGHEGRIPQLFAEMGFDALVLNRVHHNIKSAMKSSQSLEFIWNMNGNLNQSIFTHVLHTHYAAIQGFDFENGGVPGISDGNVKFMSEQYVSRVKERAASYRTNHVMIPFGDDFKFKAAEHQFSNMDQIVNYVNKNVRDVRIKYATPSEYFAQLHALHGSSTKFPVVRHDFAIYADNEDSYWTGYYTSIPNLKKTIREGEAAVRSAESALALGRAAYDISPANSLKVDWRKVAVVMQQAREDVSVTQHHDSITGTCRKHVSQDYIKRVQNAIDHASNVEKQMIFVMLAGKASAAQVSEADGTAAAVNLIRMVRDAPALDAGNTYQVIVRNPMSTPRSSLVTLLATPECVKTGVTIKDADGNSVPFQVTPVTNGLVGNVEIGFAARVHGFASHKYVVTVKSESALTEASLSKSTALRGPAGNAGTDGVKSSDLLTIAASASDLSVSSIDNDRFVVVVNKDSGYIMSVQDKVHGKTHKFENSPFLEYRTDRSGSYIFRPNKADPDPITDKLHLLVLSKGVLYDQVVVKTSRLTYTLRLYHKKYFGQSQSDFIDMNVHVNELPGNTEMVARFGVTSTEAHDKSKLITFDGLTWVKRTVKPEAPRAGQFFPSVAGGMLKFADTQLVVLTDHTMAMTPSKHGLEFMIHRRLLRDDGRGMGQANDDTSEFKFQVQFTYLAGGRTNWVALHRKSFALNNPITAFVADSTISFARSRFTPLIFGEDKMLNENLQVISLQAQDAAVSDDVVIRVQNVNPLKPVKSVQLKTQLFDPKVISIGSMRMKSLALMHDLDSSDSLGVHRLRRGYLPGDSIQFSFTTQATKSATGDSQNTDEEGVFLSDEALRLAGRKVLAAPEPEEGEAQQQQKPLADQLDFAPNSIKTFTVTLKASKSLAAETVLQPPSAEDKKDRGTPANEKEHEEKETPATHPGAGEGEHPHPPPLGEHDKDQEVKRAEPEDIPEAPKKHEEHHHDEGDNVGEDMLDSPFVDSADRPKRTAKTYAFIVLLVFTVSFLYCVFLCLNTRLCWGSKKNKSGQREKNTTRSRQRDSEDSALLPLVLGGNNVKLH